MDGTWLTDQKDYDKELFLREFAEMQKQGIKFVVASGNQYANLMTRFPEVLDKIYFVAENGALVAQGRQILHVDSLSDDIYQTLLKITTEYPYPAVVMGLVSAYVKKSSGRAYKQEMKKYMEHITVVDSFGEIDDQIFKVSLTVPEDKMSKILRELKEKYPEVGFVSGAADSIDMQTKGMNKAVGHTARPEPPCSMPPARRPISICLGWRLCPNGQEDPSGGLDQLIATSNSGEFPAWDTTSSFTRQASGRAARAKRGCGGCSERNNTSRRADNQKENYPDILP